VLENISISVNELIYVEV